jgi:hypothetical protein
MSETFESVTVHSDRAAKSGQSVNGMAGKGVIMDDEPDMVYVTSENWYGVWPINETSVADERFARQVKDMVASRPANMSMSANGKGYERLLEKLTYLHPEWLPPVTNPAEPFRVRAEGPLCNRAGQYLRLPTYDEFTWDYFRLESKGLVAE